MEEEEDEEKKMKKESEATDDSWRDRERDRERYKDKQPFDTFYPQGNKISPQHRRAGEQVAGMQFFKGIERVRGGLKPAGVRSGHQQAGEGEGGW